MHLTKIKVLNHLVPTNPTKKDFYNHLHELINNEINYQINQETAELENVDYLKESNSPYLQQLESKIEELESLLQDTKKIKILDFNYTTFDQEYNPNIGLEEYNLFNEHRSVEYGYILNIKTPLTLNNVEGIEYVK